VVEKWRKRVDKWGEMGQGGAHRRTIDQ